ncbi:MAG: EthD family reductase [Sphingobium sp.]|nr:EthD family reductase [Sphingobium sp.]
MFKRMSVLVRRDGDSQAQFSQGWLHHGEFITQLPGLRGYVQNHVEEEFAPPGGAFLRADGFVELCFDSPEAMAEAFQSSAAVAMAQDEPNFLGHGSGYSLAGYTGLRDAEEGNKLIVAVEQGDAAQLEAAIATLPSQALIRDEVTALIAKAAMAPPQPVKCFLHLFFSNAEEARNTARALAALTTKTGLQTAVFRVRTIRFA